MKMRLRLILGFLFLALCFQNCQNVAFSTMDPKPDSDTLASPPPPEPTPTPTPSPTLTETDTLVETSMNTPVEFAVVHSEPLSGVVLNFESATSGGTLAGRFEPQGADTFKLRYIPAFGFRGQERAVAVVKDSQGNMQKFNVTITVGNSLKSLQPALAVRGMGCIQCHAQVSSNIITDFGFKNDYYFSVQPGPQWWNNGGVYGDHANTFNSISLPAEKAVIVPAAKLPAVVANALNLESLADYVKSQLALSVDSGTRAAQVVEKSSVYIGAPTEADLAAAFKMAATDRLKYFKNSETAVALSGLKDEGSFFRNEGVLQCEGDVALRGPLLLDNLRLNSKSGCRLHVMGSVFLFGEIHYETQDPDRNLQISSSKSISLGLGSAQREGVFCEPLSRYALDTRHYGTSSLVNRYVSFWTIPGSFVRQSPDPAAYGQSIVNEADLIQAKAGLFYDASCRPEGRNISFERILLNAPIVHSRYEGNVSGTIIAEFSVMSLGMFKFSFDPVFTRVPVFPFLDTALYLDVK